MGNQISLKTTTFLMTNPFNLSYCDVKPWYVLKIEIDELRYSNLAIIKQKLQDLNAPLIDDKMDKIIDALKYILCNENPNTISQINYYLFSNHNFPALQIKCLNAKENQELHCTTSDININRFFCAFCHLDKM